MVEGCITIAYGVAYNVAIIDNSLTSLTIHIEADARTELPQLTPKILEAEELHRVLVAQGRVIVENRTGTIAQVFQQASRHVTTCLPIRMLETGTDGSL